MFDRRLSLAGSTLDPSDFVPPSVERRVGAAAHDLSNAVQAIACTLAVLQARLGADAGEDIGALVSAALSSTDRARTQARRLTTMLLSPCVLMEPVDVHACLRANRPILANLVGDNTDLSLDLAEEDMSIFCDATEFQNAVLNLVVNSKQALPAGGGRILVKTRAIGRNDMALDVTDNGSGMSPECLEKACTAFHTTRSQDGGTGLGLWSVKNFTEQSRGNLTIRSVEGRGTSVRLLLPRLAAARAQTPVAC